MNFKAFSFAFLAASVLLIQSCGSDTTGDSTELGALLDAAADREGVAYGECRKMRLAEAVAVFEECAAQRDDRVACMGRAIHTFLEHAGKCRPAPKPEPEPEPTTCEDRCEAKVQEEYVECLEITGKEESCKIEQGELLWLCIDEFCGEPGEPDEPEPPTGCEDRCGAVADHVYEACTSKIDSEDRCAAIARRVQEHCTDRCEGYRCDCDRDKDKHEGKHCEEGPGPRGHGHCE